jgi:hypothetical protein
MILRKSTMKNVENITAINQEEVWKFKKREKEEESLEQAPCVVGLGLMALCNFT